VMRWTDSRRRGVGFCDPVGVLGEDGSEGLDATT
jgi:hypothetical protein